MEKDVEVGRIFEVNSGLRDFEVDGTIDVCSVLLLTADLLHS